MPKYRRQQYGRYDLSKEEVERAILKTIDTTIFFGPAEVFTFGDGTAFVRGYIADLKDNEDADRGHSPALK